MMNINEIIPYENNPRKNDDAVEAVANSIKNFGFKSPIVVDANKVVVNGHTRLKASKLLGLTLVPVIIASDLTEEQCRALRLADNKIVVYRKINNFDEEIFRETDIGEEFLTEDDRLKLEKGIEVYATENLNSVLEDFE